jgi:8-oxo-dGTP pyrophosphatase MutT (NUDIX family)
MIEIHNNIFSRPTKMNKAFSSLSFRGQRGYSTGNQTATNISQNKEPKIRQKTYGAILCVKINSEQQGANDLYALVQGRYTGKWSFPKGHSNEGEHPLECTIREVGEETGIDTLPEPTEYLKVGYGNYYLFNLMEPVPLIARDDKEIMDTKWVTLEEMEHLSLNADASFYRKHQIEGL